MANIRSITVSIALASTTLASFASAAYAMDKQVSLTPSTSVNFSYAAEEEQQAITEPQVHVLEQSLPVFLKQAARRSGYQLSLSKRVRGTLKKAVLPSDIRKIMPQIAEQFDLKWHFQKKQLFVSVGSEVANRVVYLGSMKFRDLEKAAEQAGIESNSYTMSFVEESNSVIINGSVPYIANIELIIDSFKKNLSEKKVDVKVIRYGVVGN